MITIFHNIPGQAPSANQTNFPPPLAVFLCPESAMDQQTFINIALGLIATLGGWIIKGLSDHLKELRVKDASMDERINRIAVELPSKYVSKDDFQRFEGAIFAKLDRIENKIDQKADKE